MNDPAVRPRRGRWLLAPGLVLLFGARLSAQTELEGLAPLAGRTIKAIDVVGHQVTRELVIRREIRSAVGEPLSPATVAADVQRLDNLSIFAEIGVSAREEGEGVRLSFRLKEMPAWIPW